MSSQSILTLHHTVTMIVAVLLSALIATGLLGAIADLFLRDGAPLEQIVIVEHACADHALVSGREACMQSFLAASHVQSVASR